MNILTMATDAYHQTMGYLLPDPLAPETHVLYARRGGPQVVADLGQTLSRLVEAVPSVNDVEAAADFWAAQRIPFARSAWEKISRLEKLPITVVGVRDGEVVRPGDPIAIIKAPALLAGVIEPILIGEQMASMQLATRFTKVAAAVNWQTQRIFEVGLRAVDGYEEHQRKLRILKRVGLKATSHGSAAQQLGLKAVGTMGHRFTQRFQGECADQLAFNQAIDRLLRFRAEQGIEDDIPLSFLLDTRSTLSRGFPAAMRVMQARLSDIKGKLAISVRLDSGDLDTQFKVIAQTFKQQFAESGFMPGIIVESGLSAQDVRRFEQLAQNIGFDQNKVLYGLGGYLVSGISRDDVSLVYKISAYQEDGCMQPTMKFGDEAAAGKESYPGNIVLWEGEKSRRLIREIALREEDIKQRNKGFRSLFAELVVDGVVQADAMLSDEGVQSRVRERWATVTQNYVGEQRDFYADDDVKRHRPYYSKKINALVNQLRQQQIGNKEGVSCQS